MNQRNFISTGLQLILDMLIYVAPSSGRHTYSHNHITGMKFRQSRITESVVQPTITVYVNYLQLLVLCVDRRVYSMLTTKICFYMASLSPFPKWRPQKRTLMAAKCGCNKCSSYLIGYFETTSIGMNIANYFNSNIYFHKAILIWTSKTVEKWPPRGHLCCPFWETVKV